MTGSDRPWNDAGEPAADPGGEDSGGASWARPLAALAVLGVGVVALGVLAAAFVYSITTIGCACQPEGAQVSVNWEYHPENGTVVGTHAGGDELTPQNTGRLAIHVDRELVGTVGLPFSMGDQFDLEAVEPGQTVRVVWESADGDRSETIARYVPGDG